MSCDHGWALAGHPEARSIGFGVMALRYASLGYAVLPCERGGKKPHPRLLPESGGVHHATRDPDQIRSWWSLDQAAGIGVATGQVSALAVIDLDVKGTDNGIEAFAAFSADGHPLPGGYPEAHTPSGGRHIWMRIPPWARMPERPGILPGVDVKGTGGYVLAAPSARMIMPNDWDGHRVEPVPVPYAWQSGCPCSVPDAPGWLPGWVYNAPEGPGNITGRTEIPPAVLKLKETGVAVGERNRTLYRVACSLYRIYGTDSVTPLDVVRSIWMKSDYNDMPWREVMTCAESARKFISRMQREEDEAFAAAQPWLRMQG